MVEGDQQLADSGGRLQSSQVGEKQTKILQKYLTNCRSFYSCIYCRTHLANHDELISRSFQGNRSRAYLFNSVINITTGPAVQRELNTGSHAVADIFCSNCKTTIGWKYERAYVDSQKYKEGKYIIELAHVVRENRHLELDKRDMFLDAQQRQFSMQREQVEACQATIGQLHRGSLSPPSAHDNSQWSPRTSSSSFNEINSEPRITNYCHDFDTNDLSEDDEDEDEILMFPFHDDLYGERASYSILSMSRLNRKQHYRRSLNLDSAPYDWKYFNKFTDKFEAPKSGQFPSTSTRSAVDGNQSGSLSARSKTSKSMERLVLDDIKRTRRISNDSDNEIQFNLDPCEPSTSSGYGSQNCDRSMGSNDMNLEQAISSGALLSSGPKSTSSNRMHESRITSENIMTPPKIETIESMEAMSDKDKNINLNKNHSLSLDDEEFFDCCTEHKMPGISVPE